MSFQSKFLQMVLAEVDAAIMKAATPAEIVQDFATAEEARDNFRKLVLDDLAVRLGGTADVSSVTVPVAPAEADGKKKRAPMSDEAKAAMKAKRDATIASKKSGSAPASPAVVAEVPAAASVVAGDAPASPAEKKKRAPMTDEAKAAMKAKRDATLAAKTGTVNLHKIDPTWRKHLKTAAKAQGKEVSKEMEVALLAYLNHLSKEEFNAKKADEHVMAFLAVPMGTNAAGAAAVEVELDEYKFKNETIFVDADSKVVFQDVNGTTKEVGKVGVGKFAGLVLKDAAKQPTDLDVVEFEGNEYYVNPATKRVYMGEGQQDPETGSWTNYKPVGYVGMAAFAEMTLE